MFKDKLSRVPHLPGSYQFKNKDGIIIYVGKAKDLNNRLKSYFTGRVTGKTLMLVNDIVDFEYIVTSSELESLILEITLIKKYNPKYNILLKDDKSYPYIEFTNEKYPRVKVVRNINRKRNKNRLFGPFPNGYAARKVVEIINRMYPLRKCERLPKELCLYYHIHECLGYCVKDIDSSIIDNMNDEITSFLRGNAKIVRDKIVLDMTKASDSLNFEKAHELKLMIEDIDKIMEKQQIDLNNNDNFDLFNYYKEDNYICAQVFFVRNGLLFGQHTDIFNSVLDGDETILEYIVRFYDKNYILPKELIVPKELDCTLISEYLSVKVSSPTKGKVKKLLDISWENAKIKLQDELTKLKEDDSVRVEALNELKKLLKLDNVTRMEAYDNSHLFGTFYVGGMVLYEDFIPNKNEYRKYKISCDVKDDLSAMREVIYRRYYKVLMNEEVGADVILVDGGILQISAIKEVLNSLNINVPLIGLVKDKKHKTSSIIDEYGNELEISSSSKLFLFLTRIQEEVHRFAITYHRNIKSKGSLASLLDVVPGIGEVRKKELLKKLGSLKRIKEASLEELEDILNNKEIASNLKSYLEEL